MSSSSSTTSSTLTQTPSSLEFQTSGTNSKVVISQQSSTGHFDVSAYIEGNQKKVAKITGDNGYTYFGPTDNVELMNGKTNFTGSSNFSGNTQFQGNTFHNGSINTFSGSINAKDAFFNGDVQVGTSTQPKNQLITGNSTVRGNGWFDASLYVGCNSTLNGSTIFNGSATFNGGMNLGNANLTANSLASNSDIKAKGAKKFVIDHPTDNTKLIQHAAIE
ncbi:TPA: hypothetical protein ENS27_20190, partial [bacterium]|nr:hypothetical protein [bacterium]